MSETNCKTVRKEIDESPLGQNYGEVIWTHLAQCDSCRAFQKEQTGLRELVQSLGTVAAPADFDFKLRARLANHQSRERLFSAGSNWNLKPFLASAAAALLFIGVIVAIGYVNKQTSPSSIATADKQAPQPARTEAAIPKPAESSLKPEVLQTDKPSEAIADAGRERRDNQKRNRTTVGGLPPSRQLASADYSATRAPTFGAVNQSTPSRVFPIDASLQSLKVSLDDSRGNARTISLPGVSFGAQRVLASGNQLAQKGIW